METKNSAGLCTDRVMCCLSLVGITFTKSKGLLDSAAWVVRLPTTLAQIG